MSFDLFLCSRLAWLLQVDARVSGIKGFKMQVSVLEIYQSEPSPHLHNTW